MVERFTARDLGRSVFRRLQGRRAWDQLDAYMPYSAGGFGALQDRAMEGVLRTPELLNELSRRTGGSLPPRMSTREFWELHGQPDVTPLRERFDHYGSDKSLSHDYEYVYASVLGDPKTVAGVLEVGLGTNREDVLSNMGSDGRPGASVRAFRDYLPNAQVIGADVDRRILFSEDRIETHWVDQVDLDSVDALHDRLPQGLDLVIDDGLHSPDANLAILLLGLDAVRPGGWVVIEDIKPSAAAIWSTVGSLLPAYETYIVESKIAHLFCLKVF